AREELVDAVGGIRQGPVGTTVEVVDEVDSRAGDGVDVDPTGERRPAATEVEAGDGRRGGRCRHGGLVVSPVVNLTRSPVLPTRERARGGGAGRGAPRRRASRARPRDGARAPRRSAPRAGPRARAHDRAPGPGARARPRRRRGRVPTGRPGRRPPPRRTTPRPGRGRRAPP